jgi:hypothetical protein
MVIRGFLGLSATGPSLSATLGLGVSLRLFMLLRRWGIVSVALEAKLTKPRMFLREELSA